MNPADIMDASFRIIEREIGDHGFDHWHWPVVRRMIHASGDLALAQAVRFHKNPVAAAMEALRRGVTIVTDVTMVQAGVRQEAVRRLGSTVVCLLNDCQEPLADGLTRSARGFQAALTRVGDAIYVVGNAPSALRVLSAAVCEGRLRPPVIIAMPVGFVDVIESKEEALRLPVPVISIVGRKGGSAAAAATVNALLEMAIADF